MSLKLSSNATFKQRFNRYMEIQLPGLIGLGFIIFVEILVFGFALINYQFNGEFTSTRNKLGLSFLLARGTSLPIEVNTAMILLPMCRNLISALRSTPLNKVIPFDKNFEFHKLIAWFVVFFSLVHSFSHFSNFYKLGKGITTDFWKLMFFTGTGLTGNIMLASLLAIVVTSTERVRSKRFELFWYTHHLFALYFFLYSLHGGFCLIPRDFPPYCSGASFYKYWTLSGLLYLHERIMREWKGCQRTVITRVVLHPSKVVEVQFKKDSFKMKAGQYIFLCCPAVSLNQWHPFTLTSAPEDDYISVHIRMAGDFTKQFATKLGCFSNEKDGEFHDSETKILPALMIDGPFGSASEDVFNYEISILVGAGIGVTPFASILRSIWYRLYTPSKETRLCKVYFIWICRDKEAFEWFQSLLSVIEQEDTSNVIEINVYLTGKLQGDEIRNLALHYEIDKEDAITGLKTHTHYGRPNFPQIFNNITEEHASTDVGVFFCGPKPLGKCLEEHCEEYTQTGRDGTKFFYNKENF